MMDNLDDYKSYSATKYCYLDGRYFNKVFSRYPGLISSPITIDMENGVTSSAPNIKNGSWGLLRVIIQTSNSRHSNLVLIDPKEKKLYRFESLGTSARYFDRVNSELKRLFPDYEVHNFVTDKLDEKTPNCDKTGFCVAYNIKFAYDFLNKRTYDPTEIRRFANKIETHYGLLPSNKLDVEYGLFDNVSGRNVVLGGAAGGLIGAAATGSPGGALLGLGAGALIGAAIPR